MARRSRPTPSHARPIARARLWLTLLLGFLCTAGAPPAHSTPLRQLISTAAPTQSSVAAAAVRRAASAFVANRGQSDSTVRYQMHYQGGTVYFTPQAVVLALPAPDLTDAAAAPDPHPQRAARLHGIARQHWIGANATPTITGTETLPGVVNYYIGSDSSTWLTNVPTYAGLSYGSLYPGIDLTYSADSADSFLKSTYVIAANADPSRIRWRYTGLNDVHLDATGALIATLPIGVGVNAQSLTLTDAAPIAWQTINGQKSVVTVSYSIAAGGAVSFALGSYDHSQPLTIDPALSYSDVLGGNNNDLGYGVVTDSAGNAYITGQSNSTNFPTGTGTVSTMGNDDVFVTKVDANGVVQYTTMIGGTAQDDAYGLAFNGTKTLLYITGTTLSGSGFGGIPPNAGTLRTSSVGSACGAGIQCGDAFVTAVNPANGTVQTGTLLSGTGDDRGNSIAVDSVGNLYIVGQTTSPANGSVTLFPSSVPYPPNTPNTSRPMRANQGGTDAFVLSITSDMKNYRFGAYYGGSNDDYGTGIAVTTDGAAVYLSGYTASTASTFPITGALSGQATYRGGTFDAFVAKLSAATPTSPAITWSTYLGSAGEDRAESLTIDGTGTAYVVGWTAGSNFPTTIGAYQTAKNGGTDAFVSTINSAGTALGFSTLLGGLNDERGYAIALDANNEPIITGWTTTPHTATPLFRVSIP